MAFWSGGAIWGVSDGRDLRCCLSDLPLFPVQETRRAEDKVEMEDLRDDVQTLQKVLGHVHQVQGGGRQSQTKIAPFTFLVDKIMLFFSIVFTATQLVAGDVDSDEKSFSSPSSPSTSSTPVQARSPLRNATLVALQNTLFKHKQQIQVSTAPLLFKDVMKRKSSDAIQTQTQTSM